jgi:hypothetical protein
MKKILFLVTIALLCFGSTDIRAQTQTQPWGAMTITGATLTNADTAYGYTEINGTGAVAITMTVTYTSGTLAGNGSMFVSNDATNWELLSATDTMAISAPITIAGVTQKTYTWKIPISYWRYYRPRLFTTGTSVGVVSGKYKFSRDNGYR